MSKLKASYILSKSEILYLFSSIQDVLPSRPAQYMLCRCLSDSEESHDAVEGLVYKKLARKSSGKIILEPVIGLLVRAALSSDMLWIVESGDVDGSAFLLKTEDFYLHIRRYPHISDTWKITPYQSREALKEEFSGMTITGIKRINGEGNEEELEVCDSNSWIKDGEA